MSELNEFNGRDFVYPPNGDGNTGLETIGAGSANSAGNKKKPPLYGWVAESITPSVNHPPIGGHSGGYWWDSDDTLPPNY